MDTIDVGRSDRIRTCGLLVPNQAHYQTVPHPENTPLYVICFFCAIGEGTDRRVLLLQREASHIPNCATPRFLNFIFVIVKEHF